MIIRQVNEYQFAAVELTGTKPIEPPRDWDKAKEEIKKYTRPKLIKPTWAQCDNVFIVDTSVLTSFRGVMDSEDFGRVLAKIIECKGK